MPNSFLQHQSICLVRHSFDKPESWANQFPQILFYPYENFNRDHPIDHNAFHSEEIRSLRDYARFDVTKAWNASPGSNNLHGRIHHKMDRWRCDNKENATDCPEWFRDLWASWDTPRLVRIGPFLRILHLPTVLTRDFVSHTLFTPMTAT